MAPTELQEELAAESRLPEDEPNLIQETVTFDTELFRERLAFLQETLQFSHQHLLANEEFLLVLAGAQHAYTLTYPHDYLHPDQLVHEEFQQVLDAVGLSLAEGAGMETHGVTQQQLTILNEAVYQLNIANLPAIRQLITEDEFVRQLSEDEQVRNSRRQWTLAHESTTRRIRNERVRQYLESRAALEHGWEFVGNTFFRRHDDLDIYEEIILSARGITLRVFPTVDNRDMPQVESFGITWYENAGPNEGPVINTPKLFLHQAEMRQLGRQLKTTRIFTRIYPTPGLDYKQSWEIPQDLSLDALEAYMLDKEPLFAVETRALGEIST